MPINRTPPSTPTQDLVVVVPVDAVEKTSAPVTRGASKMAASSSHLTVSTQIDNYSSSEHGSQTEFCKDTVPKRGSKKKAIDVQMSNFCEEMKTMLENFKEQQNLKIEKIYQSVEKIKTQNSDIISSFELLSSKYDSIEKQISNINLACSNNQSYIQSLEEKIQKLEHSSRSACLEIRNIPARNPEAKTGLLKTVTELGKVLGIGIQPHDVRDIFRIGSKDSQNRTIILELNSVLLKEDLLYKYKKFNKEKSRLSTEHLKIPGNTQPVFISENLTPRMKRLFFLARDFTKTHNYKYCWSSGGKIFVRERDGSSLTWIKEEGDLKNLLNRKP